MKDEASFTTEEVLDYLQVNLRTVYRLIKAGKIPAVRVGRQWRFHKTDIDQWMGIKATSDLDAGEASADDRGSVPASEARPRVLVVDDEASIRDLLSTTLALGG